MPSTTPKQARTMAAAAHNPEFAAKMGIPVKVATEFNKADTGGKMLRAKRPRKPRAPKPRYGEFSQSSRAYRD